MTTDDLLAAAKIVGSLGAGFGGSVYAVKRFLNGQAQGLRRIEHTLDGHVVQTATNFQSLHTQLSATKERLAAVVATVDERGKTLHRLTEQIDRVIGPAPRRQRRTVKKHP